MFGDKVDEASLADFFFFVVVYSLERTISCLFLPLAAAAVARFSTTLVATHAQRPESQTMQI